MAITIDATVGGLNSNSYVTLVEANAYFDGRLHIDDWNSASAGERNRALAGATTRLDHENFLGGRVTKGQALRWPRSGLVDRDGWSIAHDVIPSDIKKATYELALALLGNDIQAMNTLTDFKMLKVDKIELEPNINSSRKGKLPEEVLRLIRPYISTTNSVMRA